jgi:type I restriction enzyme S subunit
MTYQNVPLESVCDILDSRRIPIKASERIPGPYPYYGANGIQDYVADYIFDDELVLLAEDGGNFGSKERPIAYRISGKSWVNNHAHVLKPKSMIDVDYLCYSLMFYDVTGLINGATRQKLTQTAMRSMCVRLREMSSQKQIVAILSEIFDLIRLKNDQLSEFDVLVKSRFIEMFGDPIINTKNWQMLVWDKVLVVKNGRNQRQVENPNGVYPICGSGGIMGYADSFLCSENSVVIGRKGSINKPYLMYEKFWNVDTAFGLEPNKEMLNVNYLFQFCKLYDFEQLNKAVTIPSLTKRDLLKIRMPIPPLHLQPKSPAVL